MAESYRFFTSVDSDRLYTAGEMNEYLYKMLGEQNGVISGVENELAVTNNGTLAVSINAGAATKNGALYINDAALSKSLNTLTSGYKRYDRIVARLDETTTRSFVVTIITGVADATTPLVPDIVAATDVLLAKILIDRSTGTYVYTVTDERVYRPYIYLSAAGIASGIHALTGKTTPVDADETVLIDSADTYSAKKLTFANLWVWVQAKIHGAANKDAIVDADKFAIVDTEASNIVKSTTWENIKAKMLTAIGKTNLATGFTIAGGTTSKTLTVSADADTVNVPTANEKTRLGDIQGATGATTALKLANLTSPASPTQQGVNLLGASGGAAKLTKMPDGATAVEAQDVWATIAGWTLVNCTADFSIAGRVRLTWNGSGSYFGITKAVTAPAGNSVLTRLRFNSALGGFVVHWADPTNKTIISGTCFATDAVLCGIGTANQSTAINIYKNSSLVSGDYIDIDWLWIGDYSYLPGSLSEEAARIANLRGDVAASGQFASQTITATNLATATKGDTIGGKKYTYVAALTASPGVEGEILKEATKEAELENENLAISEVSRANNGVKYWAAAVHPLVSSTRVNAVLTLTAKTNNGTENAITIVCESGTNHTAGGATLLGGYTDSAAKTIAEAENNIAGGRTRPAAAKIELTNTALIGYEDEVDKAVGATLTFPAGGVWIWFVHGYGSLVGGLKKGSSSGGATITMAGANGSIWYRKYS